MKLLEKETRAGGVAEGCQDTNNDGEYIHEAEMPLCHEIFTVLNAEI
jgi:hypothetical protein